MSKNILDYRLVILDNNAKIFTYSFSFGMHQTCLDDFASKMGYEYSNAKDLVANGNVIFINAGNNILGIYLPDVLNNEQLYQMDYIHNWLDKVEMLDAIKFGVNGEVYYQCTDNIPKYFSEEIIQSYYSGKKR